MNIYGAIGYTVLIDNITGQRIIIFADMHDTLESCPNKINIADWLKSNFKTSAILLEEVPRKFKLQELWSNASHTMELKDLYLNNTSIVNPVDIRPFLIDFSWEIATDDNSEYNITLTKYLQHINLFFCIENKYLLTSLPSYCKKKLPRTKLGIHFIKIKRIYKKFLINNKKYLGIEILKLKKENISILENINDILNSIMEWYICALINMNKDKPIILHAGLYHTDKVVNWLTTNYDYKLENKYGINSMNDSFYSNKNGCVKIPDNIENKF